MPWLEGAIHIISSLWIYLDCTSVEQTRVYLDCSKTSPLEIHLGEEEGTPFSTARSFSRSRISADGAKISVVTIVGSQELVPVKEVLKLRGYVAQVEYRLDDVVPKWDTIPTDVGAINESEW